MMWIAYINRKDENGEIQTDAKEFDLEGTSSMADCRSAVIHAAKLFNVNEDNILCLPKKENKCSFE